jgi:glycosyltransferase involved in cell wall biosynthesis
MKIGCFVHKNNTGLAYAAERNLQLIEELGYELTYYPEPSFLNKPRESGLDLAYWHSNPPQVWKEHWPKMVQGVPSIGFWITEVEEIWNSWVRLSESMREVWTASKWVAEAFRAKLQCPVRHVPHPLNLDRWPFQTRLHPSPFVVLCAFDGWSLITRKNPEGAVRVFKAAFSDSDAKLILKATHLSDAQRADLDVVIAGDERIEICVGSQPHAELLKLMASAHCLVSLHRSEGFGMHIAEAMVTGLPVMVTDYSGTTDFCTNQNALLVPFQRTPVVLPPLQHPPYPESATWALPDEHAAATALWILREKMRCDSGRVYAMQARALSDIGRYCEANVVKEQIRKVLICNSK